jgi:hypothetical protein
MAAKRLPQSGTNNAGADSYDPKGLPATSKGPGSPIGEVGGGGSPQFDPKNGFVKVTHHGTGSNKIGIPSALKWLFGSLPGVDSFNVRP